jgi:catechol 2,3-dioxygenase-like lactoylglutathione lyase family enzyme
MEPRISIITLGVSDLERSTKFYRDGLRLPPGQTNEKISFFQMPGTWLALFPINSLAEDAGVPAGGTGFRSFTLAHNVRTRDNVDQVIAEAVAAGATVVKQAHDTDWGGYSGYFSDPDGFLWEVAWNPSFPIG